jgi:hypothetical protein
MKHYVGIWRNTIRIYVLEETRDLNEATADELACHDFDLHGEDTLQYDDQEESEKPFDYLNYLDDNVPEITHA